MINEQSLYFIYINEGTLPERIKGMFWEVRERKLYNSTFTLQAITITPKVAML